MLYKADSITAKCTVQISHQITCQLNSVTLHKAAVSVAWPLLGPLLNGHAALHRFQKHLSL